MRLAEDIGDSLKDRIGTSDPPPLGEVGFWWRAKERWRRMGANQLAQEYIWWLKVHPALTRRMVAIALSEVAAAERALRRYLDLVEESR